MLLTLPSQLPTLLPPSLLPSPQVPTPVLTPAIHPSTCFACSFLATSDALSRSSRLSSGVANDLLASSTLNLASCSSTDRTLSGSCLSFSGSCLSSSCSCLSSPSAMYSPHFSRQRSLRMVTPVDSQYSSNWSLICLSMLEFLSILSFLPLLRQCTRPTS